VDSYRRLFRTVTTHVWVRAERTGDALAKADVLEGLREARSYAASELTQDATGFRFVARDAQNVVRAICGGAVALADAATLEVRLPVPGRVTLLRDGADVAVFDETATARWSPRVAGAYRVEATYEGRPWIWSSAIRIVE